MKRTLSKVFIFVMCLLGINDMYSLDPPDPTPPPPPGLSVDENILVLFFVVILFGVYIIYNCKLKARKQV